MWHSITAVGNLGKDPELRYTPSGSAVCGFSIAINKEYTAASGERVKQTIWMRVSVFGKTGEACNQYLKKGSRVLVVGELTPDKATGNPRIWTKQDGTSGASFEVNASTVRFLSSANTGDMAETAHQLGGMEVLPEDDIPF